MKVAQLGCGLCGLVCAEQIARHPKVDLLILADRNVAGADRLASRLSSGKVSVRKMDGTNPDVLRDLLSDADVVVASMPWRLNRIVLETAARLGVDYVDFGMPFDGTGPEFDAASALCRDEGIRALVGMGMEPGMSDVFAMHAARDFDRVDEVYVFDGDTASVEGLELFSTWSPVDLLDEMSVPAAVYADGEIRFLSPMSASQPYDFPEPVGRRVVYKTNHDETYFLPMGLPTLKNASFNIYIDPAWAEAASLLRRLGLLSHDLIDVRGVRVRPLDVVAAALPSPSGLAERIRGDACFVVEVTGLRDGRRARAKMWTLVSYEEIYRAHGTNATGYLVGTGGAVATEMLLDGEVEGKGIVIPEQLSSEGYLRRLRDKGVHVRQETVPL